MGRSVSYPSEATVSTFRYMEPVLSTCPTCDGEGSIDEDEEGTQPCSECDGSGEVLREPDSDDFDELIEDFRSQLRSMFPSVEEADDWIDREDHVLAENKLARFGVSEYCGLVSYWIVPKEYSGPKGQFYYSSDRDISAISTRWVKSIADKFVAAFGELSKVGSMSNGEGVYRRIDK
jgi:hypothetical protein